MERIRGKKGEVMAASYCREWEWGIGTWSSECTDRKGPKEGKREIEREIDGSECEFGGGPGRPGIPPSGWLEGRFVIGLFPSFSLTSLRGWCVVGPALESLPRFRGGIADLPENYCTLCTCLPHIKRTLCSSPRQKHLFSTVITVTQVPGLFSYHLIPPCI